MSLSHSSSHPNKTFSFSSHSSSSSFSSNSNSPLHPRTPLKSFGVPFSWEFCPGIRRKSPSAQNYKDPSLDQLPLPPAARSTPTNELKKSQYKYKYYVGRDPFDAALAKCSEKGLRDDSWKATKPSRSVNDLVGLVNSYTSCKTSCSVVESKVFIPRSGRAVYHLMNRRSSRFGWRLHVFQSTPCKLWDVRFSTVDWAISFMGPLNSTNWMVRISRCVLFIVGAHNLDGLGWHLCAICVLLINNVVWQCSIQAGTMGGEEASAAIMMTMILHVNSFPMYACKGKFRKMEVT